MIPYSKQSIDQDDIQEVIETLKSSHLTGGSKTEEFENSLAAYLNSKFVTTLNSATSALFAAYSAIGLKDTDEVITTPMSFAATSNMILQTGAKPVFCDILFNGNIDPNRIEQLITPKTKAIVSVDYGGNSVDVVKIQNIAKKYNLIWISDSSHSFGGEFENKKIGVFADITIFSFHAIKPITTFEGGAIATNNKEYYDFIKKFKSHGIVKKEFWNQDMVSFGYNFRLSDVASALGVSQLKKIDSFIKKRDSISQYYYQNLKDNHAIFINMPKNNIKSSFHLFSIMLDRSLWCPKEDIFQSFIDKGIGVQVHYKPIYKHSYYQKIYKDLRLLNTEEFYKAELTLPNHQDLKDSEVEYILDTTKEILEKYSKNNSCAF